MFSYRTFFILVIYSERFLTYEENYLDYVNVESCIINKSLTINFKEKNSRDFYISRNVLWNVLRNVLRSVLRNVL